MKDRESRFKSAQRRPARSLPAGKLCLCSNIPFMITWNINHPKKGPGCVCSSPRTHHIILYKIWSAFRVRHGQMGNGSGYDEISISTNHNAKIRSNLDGHDSQHEYSPKPFWVPVRLQLNINWAAGCIECFAIERETWPALPQPTGLMGLYSLDIHDHAYRSNVDFTHHWQYVVEHCFLRRTRICSWKRIFL